MYAAALCGHLAQLLVLRSLLRSPAVPSAAAATVRRASQAGRQQPGSQSPAIRQQHAMAVRLTRVGSQKLQVRRGCSVQ
eukprot:COSAG01_NODE_17987_length_1108_cov_1.213082_2_plen_79_part_00